MNEPKTAASSKSAETDLVGQSIGDFRVERILGRGGMGEVYLAQQTSLKRSVALKVLRQDLVDDENYLRRFEAEAKAVAPISHPNIVSVIAIGKDRGVHYIALEYVQGPNLREYINKKGPLDLPVSLTVMRKVSAALQRASEEGIIHRDIKPENVLITKKGEVKVADFGLARQVASAELNLTQSGVTMGTPLYMSPEQVEGKPVDHRSDLYSFGVMCYHMMAGQPPFRGETAMAVAVQHVKGTPTPLATLRPDLPKELIGVVEKLMAKDPAQRYQTAREVLRDLNRIRSAALKGNQGADDSVGMETLAVEGAPAQTTSTLQLLVQVSVRFRDLISAAKNRRALVAASLAVALVAGIARGWYERPTNLDRLPRSDKQAVLPDHTSIKTYSHARFQLAHAHHALPEDQRQAGLWAVIKNHPGDEYEVIAASQELIEDYLSHRDYELAMQLADYLATRDSHTVKMFGNLFKGIVLSRQRQPKESNAAFLVMLDNARFHVAAWEQRVWLARQFLLAYNLNSEMLRQPPDPKIIENFKKNFLLSPQRSRG